MTAAVMVRFVLPGAALLAMLVAAVPAGQAPDSGSIGGRVRITRGLPGAALPSAAYPTRAVRSHETHPIPEIKNVVVSLKNVNFRGALPPRRAELHQDHETFVPHVLAVTRGSTVDFPNDDPIYHNVFSLSTARQFNLGRFPQGQSKSETFNNTGIVKVYCDIHSHMSATILVFDHPFFAVPRDDGSFEIPNLPPAEYTVAGWHERVGERVLTVRVERGRRTTIDLSLPITETP